MSAPAPVAPPRWPADATLLRDVFRAARRKHWHRVHGGSERVIDDVAVVAEWDQDGSFITLERYPIGDLVLDINGVIRMDVVSLELAVDVLVASGVLPVTLSSAYRMGRESIADEVHACAEFGEGSHAFFAMAGIMPVLGDALTYWSSIACSDAVEAVVGSRLDGLLDREPFARRRQTEDAVSAVMDALASHLAALVIKEREAGRG